MSNIVFFLAIFWAQVRFVFVLLTQGETATVNILNILKNPMILLGLVSMGIFVGMPYLVDNSKS